MGNRKRAPQLRGPFGFRNRLNLGLDWFRFFGAINIPNSCNRNTNRHGQKRGNKANGPKQSSTEHKIYQPDRTEEC